LSCSTATNSRYRLTVARGSKRTILVTVRDELGNLVNLDGARLYFTVRHRTEDIATVIVKKSTLAGGSDAQIEILDQTTYRGQCRVKLLGSDTANLRPDLAYWYDMFVTLAADGPYEIIPRSEFAITATITRSF
jgi:hypothetical protein